jgi:hypothetical protein
LAFCLVYVAWAVGENLTHTHLIQPYLGGEVFLEEEGDFRGTAGFAHPLTGAAVTMMCLLSIMALELPPVVLTISFLVLSVGLLAFGGRTALGVGFFALGSITIFLLIRGLVMQRLNARLLAAVLLAIVFLPPLAYGLLNYTNIGERLISHFYVDESAEVRSVQWRVLDDLAPRDLLFGIPEERVPLLISNVNMDERLSAIENPWLLTFLKIGALGFLIFLASLIPFLVRLWSKASLWGRTVLISGLIVISASNSLGVKSDLLFFLTAFVITAGNYRIGTRASVPASTSRERPGANWHHRDQIYLPAPPFRSRDAFRTADRMRKET